MEVMIHDVIISIQWNKYEHTQQCQDVLLVGQTRPRIPCLLENFTSFYQCYTKPKEKFEPLVLLELPTSRFFSKIIFTWIRIRREKIKREKIK